MAISKYSCTKTIDDQMLATMSPTRKADFEMTIKRNAARSLIDSLIKDGKIEFIKDYEPMFNRTNLQANVYVADRKDYHNKTYTYTPDPYWSTIKWSEYYEYNEPAPKYITTKKGDEKVEPVTGTATIKPIPVVEIKEEEEEGYEEGIVDALTVLQATAVALENSHLKKDQHAAAIIYTAMRKIENGQPT